MYVDPGINTSASNLKWVLPYCKPDLPRVVGALLLFIANNTMALTIPILSGIIVDRVIVGGHADELPRLCGLMILMTIIRVGARYGYQMWMERFGQNSVYRLVSDEYEKLHELDFTYFNHTRTGDIMSRLTSDTDAIRHCLSWVSYQIADCVVMFVGAPVRDVRHRLATRARPGLRHAVHFCAHARPVHARPPAVLRHPQLAGLPQLHG